MAINPIKFLVSPSVTATNGSDVIAVTGNVDCSKVYDGTVISLNGRQIVEAISGTQADGSGNSTITLRSNWTQPTTTTDMIAFNAIEGLPEAIRKARQLVENINSLDALPGDGVVHKLATGEYELKKITTSTTDDTVGRLLKVGDFEIGTSEFLKTIDFINDLSVPYVFDTVASYQASTIVFPVGKVVKLLDRNADFKVIAGVGTANTFDIIANNLVTQSLDLVSNYNLELKAFGAVGDNVADDLGAINAAISRAKGLPFGALIKGDASHKYRTTNEIVIDKNDIILDLNGGTIDADFAVGWAVLIGDGVTAFGGLGIRNGFVVTDRIETTLSGIKYRKNVRRQVAYEGLRVGGFKGTGIEFEELNWSLQGGFAPLIESCGTNLSIDDNVNAISIVGIGLADAVDNNCVIRGAFQVTFVGGYIQEAGVAGVDIGTGGTQMSDSVCFYGTYFESNGSNHIVARDGKSLNISGCYMNCSQQTGSAISLINWAGADIAGNSPVGLSAGTQRDFVSADANCQLIDVGKQNVTTKSDANICQSAGASKAGLVQAFNTELDVLPTVSNLNIGSIVQYVPSGLGSSRPYIARTNAAADRRFSELALKPIKSAAGAGGATLTPNLSSVGIYDISMTANMTINAPIGEFKDGDSFTVILKQDGVGGKTVTWNAIYKTDYTAVGDAAGAYMSRTFTYSAGRALWIQTGALNWT